MAVRTTNGLYSLRIFNGSKSANTSKKFGGGDEIPTILFENKPSLKDLCAIINDSNIECTCENFKDFCKQSEESRVFVCNRYWDKVEATVSVTVSVIGVLGNTLVLLIAFKTWQDSRRIHKLVAVLALADLIFATVEIVTSAQLFKTCKWLFKTFFCKFSSIIRNIGGVFALCLIVIIALERYLAIVKPFSRNKFQLPFWIWPLVALIFSIVSVTPLFIVYEVSTDGICVEKWPQGSNGSLIYSCFLLFGTVMIPMGIISYFYYCIVKKILANAQNLKATGNGKEVLKKRERSNRRIMIILFAIACAFFVLVSPNRIIWVVLDITGTDNLSNSTYRILKYTGLFPYYFHVSVNPFIYSFIDKRFQGQLVDLFKSILKDPLIKLIRSTHSANQMTSDTV